MSFHFDILLLAGEDNTTKQILSACLSFLNSILKTERRQQRKAAFLETERVFCSAKHKVKIYIFVS